VALPGPDLRVCIRIGSVPPTLRRTVEDRIGERPDRGERLVECAGDRQDRSACLRGTRAPRVGGQGRRSGSAGVGRAGSPPSEAHGFVTDNSRHVVPVIADLVDCWTAAGGPVIFTRHLNHPDSMFHSLMSWTKLTDSPDTDTVDELQDAARRAIVIDKKGYTLFNDQGRALVEEKGWTDLVFCASTPKAAS
jgi:hypothetical protein